MKLDELKRIIFLLFLSLTCSFTEIKYKNQGDSDSPQRFLEVKQTESNLSKNKSANENTRKTVGEGQLNGGFGPSLGGSLGMFPPFSPASPVDSNSITGNLPQSNSFNQGGSSFGQMMPAMNTMMAGNMMLSNAMMNPALQGFPNTLPLNNFGQGNLLQNEDGFQDDDNGFDFGSSVDLMTEVYDDASGLRVASKCGSVKSQAIEIANRIMKKQNTKIFRELISYLVKSKFLIGLTEIKLARSLRKRIFSLMGAFSTLNQDQFNFVNLDNNIDFKENLTPFFLPDDKGSQLFDKSFANKAYPEIDNFIRKDFENGSLKSLNAKI